MREDSREILQHFGLIVRYDLGDHPDTFAHILDRVVDIVEQDVRDLLASDAYDDPICAGCVATELAGLTAWALQAGASGAAARCLATVVLAIESPGYHRRRCQGRVLA